MINQKLAWLLAIIILTASCKKSTIYSVTNDDVVIEVNPNYFLQAGLAENITKVIKTVSNGLTLECCKIFKPKGWSCCDDWLCNGWVRPV
jgi:hypothetical protein